MKRFRKLCQAYGRMEEFDLADIPAKCSNVMLERIRRGGMGCSYCFPHGPETHNAQWIKNQRNWKKFRRTPWKTRDKT